MTSSPLLRPSDDQMPRAGRFIAFALVVVLIVAALGVRLFYLQISQGSQYAGLAQSQAAASEPVPSTRGLIYDRAGRPLVTNVASYSVKIVPAELPFSQRDPVVRQLASLLDVDPTDIATQLDSSTGSRFDPVRVAVDVPETVARVIEEEHLALPGVQVVVEARREYTDAALFGNIVGYTGAIDAQEYAGLKSEGYQADDIIGKAGLEASYEAELRGQYGQQTVARDATGRTIPGMVTPIKAAEPGDSLVLSIDSHEQQLAAKALSWGVKGAGVTKGVIIVENPQTGEILAMVSMPGYDDNLFAKGISNKDFQKLVSDPDKPLVNKAISEQYAPGSTFKAITGTAALQDGRMTNHTVIESKPYIQLGSWKFWEWNHAGFGPLDIYSGFAHSSDTFFYQVAQRVGIDRLSYWAHQFGFGAPSGIDLPDEVGGIVPDNQWKMNAMGLPMYPGELLQAGIGQGYDAATPLQLLNAYAAIANGGRLYQPQVVREVVQNENGHQVVVRPFQPKLIRQLPISAQNLQTMRVAARNVVTSRHTYNLVDMPITVAGKTGTAEFGVPDQYGRLPYHQWFVGFTPGNPYAKDTSKPDSQLAVVAFVYGADTWGDTATEIVKYYMALHYNLKADPLDQNFAHNPWHVNQWVLTKTNFYGTANNN